MTQKVSFHWSNYVRPTPKNLEFMAASARRMVAVIAGITVIMEANKWWPVAVIVLGALLDELKNFFAYVATGDKEVVSVSFPSEVADQIEIKQETKSKQDDSTGT